MEVIVPSFSGAGSAEQPQSTVLQFGQTQDGSVEHPTEAWPHQVEGIQLQGVWGMPRSVHATWELLQGQVQLLGFKGSNCLGAAGVCHRRVLLAVQSSAGQLLLLQLAFTGAGLTSSEMLGTDLSSCRSCLPAVLCTCLDRVFVLWSTVHFHG